MRFAVHSGDELPIYRQIMRQMREGIASGRLRAGEKVPSHRELAEQLVIAPLTVKKAYDELEKLGLLETQRGKGTFICDRLPKFRREDQIAELRTAARHLLTSAQLAGMDLNEVVALLKEVEQQSYFNTSGIREEEGS